MTRSLILGSQYCTPCHLEASGKRIFPFSCELTTVLVSSKFVHWQRKILGGRAAVLRGRSGGHGAVQSVLADILFSASSGLDEAETPPLLWLLAIPFLMNQHRGVRVPAAAFDCVSSDFQSE